MPDPLLSDGGVPKITGRFRSTLHKVKGTGGIIRCDGDMLALAAPRPYRATGLNAYAKRGPFSSKRPVRLPAGASAMERRSGIRARSIPPKMPRGSAWRELHGRSYRLCGDRLTPSRCAGCGRLTGAGAALNLDMHIYELSDPDCRARWWGEATKALAAVRLGVPPGEQT
jgi:hypothetical protein